MTEQEKRLFQSLCSFQSESFDRELLSAASPTVLGQLFFYRMQAIAYGTLAQNKLLGAVNREFRNSLKAAYTLNIEKNRSFFSCVRYLEKLLSDCTFNYAMLKGAYLCKLYPDGYRTSNDIDLLVAPENVTKVGNVLLNAGFRQGNVRNEEFYPASRRQIIESKMMRGETVPYIKEMNLPQMKFLEVDLNFSLDYKPNDGHAVEELLRNTEVKEIDGYKVRTLSDEDFLVHLCCHLYKEATTLPWVEMKRDMTLYKYCDIYLLLNHADKQRTDRFFARARVLGLEKICAFAVRGTAELFAFTNAYAARTADDILRGRKNLLHTVVSPKDKKSYEYSVLDIKERLFSENRVELLKEVKTPWSL